jgi:beta-glucanase (GH16 family)
LLFADNYPGWVPCIAEVNSTLPVPAGFDSRADFHTYAFEWLPDSIKWFVDDKLVRTKLPGQGQYGLKIPELSAKVMMNLWIFAGTDFGGTQGGNNQYPMISEYDYFRFYKWNNETTYPCSPTPGCLPAEDKDFSKNNPEDGIN